MKQAEKAKIYIDRTQAAIEPILVKNWFKKHPKSFYESSYRHRYWIRDCKWCVFVVRMLYRCQDCNSIILDFSVHVPHDGSPFNFEHGTMLDSISLSYLYRKKPFYPFRSFLGFVTLYGIEKYISEMVCDLRESMKWFDDFDTPQKCLERFNNRDRNGVRSEGMKKYLENLCVNQ